MFFSGSWFFSCFITLVPFCVQSVSSLVSVFCHLSPWSCPHDCLLSLCFHVEVCFAQCCGVVSGPNDPILTAHETHILSFYFQFILK